MLRLLDEAHGPGDGWDRTSDFFRWKHQASPFGPTLMLVADAGDIVGLKALMPWRLSTPTGPLVVGRGVDAATALGARRTGIFTNLTRAALVEASRHGYAAIWSTPNDPSFLANVKAGASDVGRLAQLVLPLRPLAMLSTIVRRRRDRRARWEPAVPLLVPARELLEDEVAVRRLIQADAVREPRLLRTERSLDWLRWRYAQPSPPPYLAAWSTGTPAHALIIVRLTYARGLREMMVTELLADDDPRPARALLRSVARSIEPDYVIAAAPRGSFHDRLLRGAGFLPAPKRYGLRLTARPLAWPATNPDVTALASWGLSLGDIELL